MCVQVQEVIRWVDVGINLIQAFFVIGASVVAIKGINAWRHEHRGRRKIDTAEQAMRVFLEIKDKIQFVRNALIGNEPVELPGIPGHLDKVADIELRKAIARASHGSMALVNRLLT